MAASGTSFKTKCRAESLWVIVPSSVVGFFGLPLECVDSTGRAAVKRKGFTEIPEFFPTEIRRSGGRDRARRTRACA